MLGCAQIMLIPLDTNDTTLQVEDKPQIVSGHMVANLLIGIACVLACGCALCTCCWKRKYCSPCWCGRT